MFKAIGSVFSKLGKSAAFKGTLAAIGTVVAGVVGAKLSGVATERGLPPAQAAAVVAANVPKRKTDQPSQLAGMLPASLAQIPWTPILIILAIGVGGYLLTRRGR